MMASARILATLFVREAVRTLLRNKVRSALTALGITIGVAAVVLIVAVGEAGSAAARAQLQALGDNFVWIEAGSRNVNGARTGTHGMTTLTLEDAEAIRREVPLIRDISPQADGTTQVIHGNQNWATRFRGESPDYLRIKRYGLAAGVMFSDEDVAASANKVVLGETVRQQLFGAASPVGWTPSRRSAASRDRPGSQPLRSIGTSSHRGQLPHRYPGEAGGGGHGPRGLGVEAWTVHRVGGLWVGQQATPVPTGGTEDGALTGGWHLGDGWKRAAHGWWNGAQRWRRATHGWWNGAHRRRDATARRVRAGGDALAQARLVRAETERRAAPAGHRLRGGGRVPRPAPSPAARPL